jgi:surfactin synthase thioesterase subunit
VTVATPRARRPVVAFLPPACCGAGYFSPLRRAFGSRIEFLAVERPGLGRRYREPALTEAAAGAADVVSRLGVHVDAIYGESLGAYLGLAVAARLSQSWPPLLIVASNCPPSVRGRIDTSQVQSIQAAIAAMRTLGGEIPVEVIDHPELADQAFRVIRDDLDLSQSLIGALRETRIAGNIQVICGDDDPAATQPEWWGAHTTGSCRVVRLPGGHLLSRANPSGVADAVLSSLAGR